MSSKPVIVFVGTGSSSSMPHLDDIYFDGVSYFLKDRFGMDIVSYRSSYYFKESLKDIKALFEKGLIAIIVVKQERYSHDHTDIIKVVRKKLGKRLPIVVIVNGMGEEQFKGVDGDKFVVAFDPTEPSASLSLIDEFVSNFKPPINYFGAETREDQAILLSQLENAYYKNYLENGDDDMLGVPDSNGQTVAEAIRLRLLPAELIKEEFDSTLKREPRKFVPAEPSLYENECSKIKAMNDEERKEFDHCLLRARGCEPAEGGGVYVRRTSCGNDVNGYAIDPVTLEHIITSGFGEHRMAKQILFQRIEIIECLRLGLHHTFYLPDEVERECKRRITAGLIFTSIEGFTTPILQLYRDALDSPSDHLDKIIKFIKKEQKFIPVDFDGNLL